MERGREERREGGWREGEMERGRKYTAYMSI